MDKLPTRSVHTVHVVWSKSEDLLVQALMRQTGVKSRADAIRIAIHAHYRALTGRSWAEDQDTATETAPKRRSRARAEVKATGTNG